MQTLYGSRSNEVRFELQEAGVAKDLSTAVSIALHLYGAKTDPVDGVAAKAIYDTVADPTLFDITSLVTGVLIFKPEPNDLVLLTEPKYYGWLVVFTGTYPNGLVWSDGYGDLTPFVIIP